ncbi:MAG TPA: hypothetical protein VHX88_05825 [Solirubrobacteraceae bacterium]|nr:hypothetical protein [Solirubrobacteraceae bacterium]
MSRPGESADRSDAATELMLRLAVDGEGRPSGMLRTADGHEVPFAGWLGLMSELSRLLDLDGR